MSLHVTILAQTGTWAFSCLVTTGRTALFLARVIASGITPPFYLKKWKDAFLEWGFFSLPMVGLTALFTGMVLALQSYTGFARFQAENSIASVVALSITRELGPVLTGLMIAGRLSSATAAEIGTMRITQQIDALITLGIHPYRYLIWPRICAGILTMPLLALIADIIGIFGGYLVAVYRLDFAATPYLHQSLACLYYEDISSGLIKACIFGFIIAVTGCYQGCYATGGAEGVGKRSTRAVVTSSITILLSNYLLTNLFFSA